MWGTAPIDRLCRKARQLGYKRLALTDTDNLYGLWPFLASCRREGLTPIIGAEVTDPDTNDRIICLVKTAQGYRNLCRILTRRKSEKDFSLKSAVPEQSADLLIMTSNPGLLFAWSNSGVHVTAALHGNPPPSDHPLRIAARRLGVPITALPSNYFLDPEDYEFHRLCRAIGLNTSLSRLSDHDTANRNAWLAPPEIYERRFSICPEAIRNTYETADMLTFTRPDFGVVMPPRQKGDSESETNIALRKAVYAGAFQRYGSELPEPVVDRLEHELKTIAKMGFSGYFLVVRDIVSQSPRTCGRGSGAASLAAYCLGITNVCPVKHNLYFERFLNPGRKDPPDIDIDFAWDERDAVLNSVLEKFRGHAAMVASHILFQPRMAVRETAKVYGLTDSEISRVTSRTPWFMKFQDQGADLMDELEKRPETSGLDLPAPWPEILHYAERLIGAPRYLSVHPGGVVITPNPISSYVPVEYAPKGVPVINWEKDGTEEAGLVKIDLLGNRSLGVIRDALENLRRNGVRFDETGWAPEDDPDTQNALARGNTMGCFYIESPAMRLLQKKTGKGDFEHIVIHSSIIRPAANEYIREYIRRLHGGSWDPIHPLLSDVLDETYGIMVYQEDVSRTAVSMAGFDHADADGLRKILSKKDRLLRMGDFQERFFKGASERGVSVEKIEQVWRMILSFSGYSFCKPHSASYARVSFQAAYLKTHYPAEFMAAVISNQGGYYDVFAYVSEAKRMDLTILGPDVNLSESRWIGKEKRIRAGLISVKGLSSETGKRIVYERKKDRFKSIADFIRRVRPDDPEINSLIHCGALDGLNHGDNRAVLFWETARLKKTKHRRNDCYPLFEESAEDTEQPILPPESPIQRMRKEFAVLGFLCNHHPMEFFAGSLQKTGAVKAGRLSALVGKHIRIGGWMITGKPVRTSKGDYMEFFTFEDETDIFETVFFPKTYKRYCRFIEPGRPYLLFGKVESEWGAVTLTVNAVNRLIPDTNSRNTVSDL